MDDIVERLSDLAAAAADATAEAADGEPLGGNGGGADASGVRVDPTLPDSSVSSAAEAAKEEAPGAQAVPSPRLAPPPQVAPAAQTDPYGSRGSGTVVL